MLFINVSHNPFPLSIFTGAYFIASQMQKNSYVISFGEILRGKVFFFFNLHRTQGTRFSSQLCYSNLLASRSCHSPQCVKQKSYSISIMIWLSDLFSCQKYFFQAKTVAYSNLCAKHRGYPVTVTCLSRCC